ncbi:phosphoadenosine phosphosulfate reductase [Ruminiclostridium papyrosolvens DSM 2782]|uniref:Phosphoadenosine phosphosulfate reductase n=1 Tax=Ruminiclostridium papyrosolvens DSM 2782 TaxID=588581 RepID=F1TIK2_9FIRM|nr:DNA phosphorothioation system sulfurtransferase DndC [Ruminiclostridium papyrosolvens]EGD45819.1 phosphoadenosine phosphosulfate reductase [Ruminiclostridium papyrosolvens DSM 2782]WES33861.1 DNA phosphorothioation system sulfurtransferase DndC [Ruminiclostridium papyrosolvens DSM 2782]
MSNSYFNENTLEDLMKEIEYVYLSDNRPWIIGYSGGKDSTVVVHLVYTMLLQLDPQKRHKPVYVVSSDTMVENPLIKEYLSDMITAIGNAAKRDKVPLTCKLVQPDPSNTFWANVIGRGFPTPRLNGSFRWCTDRLKIAPSGTFIENIINKHNSEVVILLGVRKDESITRKKRIEDREIIGKLLNRHETIKDAYVYPPIVELTTEDVWDIISSNNNIAAWGTSNSRIIELYAGADSGECPFAGVSSKNEQTQSCGQSRFGCWICTVVKEDKSLNGFIRSGHRELIPLAEFRKWLISIRDIEANREKKRRDGKVYFTPSGKIGLGPFTWEMRKEILTRLLRLQEQINYELITIPELKAIDKIWDDELDLTRLELVNLYYDVTGKKLPWHDLKKPLFDIPTIEKLSNYAEEYDVPIDLVKNLIFVTTKNKHFSNPKILRGNLEKSLTQQWLHASVLKELEDED